MGGRIAFTKSAFDTLHTISSSGSGAAAAHLAQEEEALPAKTVSGRR
jgi:hypothetical protein